MDRLNISKATRSQRDCGRRVARAPWHSRTFAAGGAMLWLVTNIVSAEPQKAAGSYQPENVHRAAPALPGHVQRVVLLPLACDPGNYELSEGRDALEPVLHAELLRTKKLEVVRLAPDVLRNLTGREVWTTSDVLPAKFVEAIRESTGCDAILFAELTEFRAYAPMAVGWRLCLVDARTKTTLWAVDEVLDAGQSAVAADARRFDRRECKNSAGTTDQWSMLNSPRRFGRFTVNTLLAAMPER